jgi:3-methyladenine DNA glycosylase AlkC
MEQMAIDMGTLLLNAFPVLGHHAHRMRTSGLVRTMRLGGQVLWDEFGDRAWQVTASHSSDSVRGWGAMAIGVSPHLTLAERLAFIRAFADDDHFAVREWAWLAIRPHVVTDPLDAIELLTSWTASRSPYIRRFASEVTRPRGVWSVHIALLKREPWIALPVLRPLRSDPALYVQNSVGNWLNDASRTQPSWVKNICLDWLAHSDTGATRRICRRGQRSLAATASD